MTKVCLAPAATALALLLAIAPARAGTATRAWVSGHGTDAAGCGAPTRPCRSLQYTHDNIVAAGGEIDVLDPAGYGAIAITKGISIINDGVGTAGVQAASGDAISIDAGAAAVVLRGLDIEGVGADYGVLFNTGGSLTVEDCTISGFALDGLSFQPAASASLFVSNTRLANNVGAGVGVQPSVIGGSATIRAVLNRVEAANNSAGVLLAGNGDGLNVKVKATLSDSMVANNVSTDLLVFGTSVNATAFLMVRNSSISNSSFGIHSSGAGSTVDLTHSTVTGNDQAFHPDTGGVINSYGDNSVDGNVSIGTNPTAATLQ